MARKYKGSFRLPLNRKSRPLRPTGWEHKSRGYVRKSNTPPTMPDLQGYKKMVGVSTPNRTKHPHHQETVGSALLSHNPPVAVPSAQKGLTSRFGKDTGCNPLAKTTNTTKISNTPKGNHSPVSETIYPLNNPTPKGRVGREPHSGRKHHQKQHQPKPVDATRIIVSYRSISTSKLVTLQCLHS